MKIYRKARIAPARTGNGTGGGDAGRNIEIEKMYNRFYGIL